MIFEYVADLMVVSNGALAVFAAAQHMFRIGMLLVASKRLLVVYNNAVLSQKLGQRHYLYLCFVGPCC